MNVLEAIYSRRAVRNFLEPEVERNTIQTLLKAAVQAPSAINQQPWAFAVFQGRELLQDYSERARRFLLQEILSGGGASPFERLREHISNPEFNFFYNAGTLV